MVFLKIIILMILTALTKVNAVSCDYSPQQIQKEADITNSTTSCDNEEEITKYLKINNLINTNKLFIETKEKVVTAGVNTAVSEYTYNFPIDGTKVVYTYDLIMNEIKKEERTTSLISLQEYRNNKYCTNTLVKDICDKITGINDSFSNQDKKYIYKKESSTSTNGLTLAGEYSNNFINTNKDRFEINGSIYHLGANDTRTKYSKEELKTFCEKEIETYYNKEKEEEEQKKQVEETNSDQTVNNSNPTGGDEEIDCTIPHNQGVNEQSPSGDTTDPVTLEDWEAKCIEQYCQLDWTEPKIEEELLKNEEGWRKLIYNIDNNTGFFNSLSSSEQNSPEKYNLRGKTTQYNYPGGRFIEYLLTDYEYEQDTTNNWVVKNNSTKEIREYSELMSHQNFINRYISNSYTLTINNEGSIMSFLWKMKPIKDISGTGISEIVFEDWYKDRMCRKNNEGREYDGNTYSSVDYDNEYKTYKQICDDLGNLTYTTLTNSWVGYGGDINTQNNIFLNDNHNNNSILSKTFKFNTWITGFTQGGSKTKADFTNECKLEAKAIFEAKKGLLQQTPSDDNSTTQGENNLIDTKQTTEERQDAAEQSARALIESNNTINTGKIEKLTNDTYNLKKQEYLIALGIDKLPRVILDDNEDPQTFRYMSGQTQKYENEEITGMSSGNTLNNGTVFSSTNMKGLQKQGQTHYGVYLANQEKGISKQKTNIGVNILENSKEIKNWAKINQTKINSIYKNDYKNISDNIYMFEDTNGGNSYNIQQKLSESNLSDFIGVKTKKTGLDNYREIDLLNTFTENGAIGRCSKDSDIKKVALKCVSDNECKTILNPTGICIGGNDITKLTQMIEDFNYSKTSTQDLKKIDGSTEQSEIIFGFDGIYKNSGTCGGIQIRAWYNTQQLNPIIDVVSLRGNCDSTNKNNKANITDLCGKYQISATGDSVCMFRYKFDKIPTKIEYNLNDYAWMSGMGLLNKDRKLYKQYDSSTMYNVYGYKEMNAILKGLYFGPYIASQRQGIYCEGIKTFTGTATSTDPKWQQEQQEQYDNCIMDNNTNEDEKNQQSNQQISDIIKIIKGNNGIAGNTSVAKREENWNKYLFGYKENWPLGVRKAKPGQCAIVDVSTFPMNKNISNMWKGITCDTLLDCCELEKPVNGDVYFKDKNGNNVYLTGDYNNVQESTRMATLKCINKMRDANVLCMLPRNIDQMALDNDRLLKKIERIVKGSRQDAVELKRWTNLFQSSKDEGLYIDPVKQKICNNTMTKKCQNIQEFATEDEDPCYNQQKLDGSGLYKHYIRVNSSGITKHLCAESKTVTFGTPVNCGLGNIFDEVSGKCKITKTKCLDPITEVSCRKWGDKKIQKVKNKCPNDNYRIMPGNPDKCQDIKGIWTQSDNMKYLQSQAWSSIVYSNQLSTNTGGWECTNMGGKILNSSIGVSTTTYNNCINKNNDPTGNRTFSGDIVISTGEYTYKELYEDFGYKNNNEDFELNGVWLNGNSGSGGLSGLYNQVQLNNSGGNYWKNSNGWSVEQLIIPKARYDAMKNTRFTFLLDDTAMVFGPLNRCGLGYIEKQDSVNSPNLPNPYYCEKIEKIIPIECPEGYTLIDSPYNTTYKCEKNINFCMDFDEGEKCETNGDCPEGGECIPNVKGIPDYIFEVDTIQSNVSFQRFFDWSKLIVPNELEELDIIFTMDTSGSTRYSHNQMRTYISKMISTLNVKKIRIAKLSGGTNTNLDYNVTDYTYAGGRNTNCQFHAVNTATSKFKARTGNEALRQGVLIHFGDDHDWNGVTEGNKTWLKDNGIVGIAISPSMCRSCRYSTGQTWLGNLNNTWGNINGGDTGWTEHDIIFQSKLDKLFINSTQEDTTGLDASQKTDFYETNIDRYLWKYRPIYDEGGKHKQIKATRFTTFQYDSDNSKDNNTGKQIGVGDDAIINLSAYHQIDNPELKRCKQNIANTGFEFFTKRGKDGRVLIKESNVIKNKIDIYDDPTVNIVSKQKEIRLKYRKLIDTEYFNFLLNINRNGTPIEIFEDVILNLGEDKTEKEEIRNQLIKTYDKTADRSSSYSYITNISKIKDIHKNGHTNVAKLINQLMLEKKEDVINGNNITINKVTMELENKPTTNNEPTIKQVLEQGIDLAGLKTTYVSDWLGDSYFDLDMPSASNIFSFYGEENNNTNLNSINNNNILKKKLLEATLTNKVAFLNHTNYSGTTSRPVKVFEINRKFKTDERSVNIYIPAYAEDQKVIIKTGIEIQLIKDQNLKIKTQSLSADKKTLELTIKAGIAIINLDYGIGVEEEDIIEVEYKGLMVDLEEESSIVSMFRKDEETGEMRFNKRLLYLENKQIVGEISESNQDNIKDILTRDIVGSLGKTKLEKIQYFLGIPEMKIKEEEVSCSEVKKHDAIFPLALDSSMIDMFVDSNNVSKEGKSYIYRKKVYLEKDEELEMTIKEGTNTSRIQYNITGYDQIILDSYTTINTQEEYCKSNEYYEETTKKCIRGKKVQCLYQNDIRMYDESTEECLYLKPVENDCNDMEDWEKENVLVDLLVDHDSDETTNDILQSTSVERCVNREKICQSGQEVYTKAIADTTDTIVTNIQGIFVTPEKIKAFTETVSNGVTVPSTNSLEMVSGRNSIVSVCMESTNKIHYAPVCAKDYVFDTTKKLCVYDKTTVKTFKAPKEGQYLIYGTTYQNSCNEGYKKHATDPNLCVLETDSTQVESKEYTKITINNNNLKEAYCETKGYELTHLSTKDGNKLKCIKNTLTREEYNLINYRINEIFFQTREENKEYLMAYKINKLDKTKKTSIRLYYKPLISYKEALLEEIAKWTGAGVDSKKEICTNVLLFDAIKDDEDIRLKLSVIRDIRSMLLGAVSFNDKTECPKDGNNCIKDRKGNDLIPFLDEIGTYNHGDYTKYDNMTGYNFGTVPGLNKSTSIKEDIFGRWNNHSASVYDNNEGQVSVFKRAGLRFMIKFLKIWYQGIETGRKSGNYCKDPWSMYHPDEVDSEFTPNQIEEIRLKLRAATAYKYSTAYRNGNQEGMSPTEAGELFDKVFSNDPNVNLEFKYNQGGIEKLFKINAINLNDFKTINENGDTKINPIKSYKKYVNWWEFSRWRRCDYVTKDMITIVTELLYQYDKKVSGIETFIESFIDPTQMEKCMNGLNLNNHVEIPRQYFNMNFIKDYTSHLIKYPEPIISSSTTKQTAEEYLTEFKAKESSVLDSNHWNCIDNTRATQTTNEGTYENETQNENENKDKKCEIININNNGENVQDTNNNESKVGIKFDSIEEEKGHALCNSLLPSTIVDDSTLEYLIYEEILENNKNSTYLKFGNQNYDMENKNQAVGSTTIGFMDLYGAINPYQTKICTSGIFRVNDKGKRECTSEETSNNLIWREFIEVKVLNSRDVILDTTPYLNDYSNAIYTSGFVHLTTPPQPECPKVTVTEQKINYIDIEKVNREICRTQDTIVWETDGTFRCVSEKSYDESTMRKEIVEPLIECPSRSITNGVGTYAKHNSNKFELYYKGTRIGEEEGAITDGVYKDKDGYRYYVNQEKPVPNTGGYLPLCRLDISRLYNRNISAFYGVTQNENYNVGGNKETIIGSNFNTSRGKVRHINGYRYGHNINTSKGLQFAIGVLKIDTNNMDLPNNKLKFKIWAYGSPMNGATTHIYKDGVEYKQLNMDDYTQSNGELSWEREWFWERYVDVEIPVDPDKTKRKKIYIHTKGYGDGSEWWSISHIEKNNSRYKYNCPTGYSRVLANHIDGVASYTSSTATEVDPFAANEICKMETSLRDTVTDCPIGSIKVWTGNTYTCKKQDPSNPVTNILVDKSPSCNQVLPGNVIIKTIEPSEKDYLMMFELLDIKKMFLSYDKSASTSIENQNQIKSNIMDLPVYDSQTRLEELEQTCNEYQEQEIFRNVAVNNSTNNLITFIPYETNELGILTCPSSNNKYKYTEVNNNSIILKTKNQIEEEDVKVFNAIKAAAIIYETDKSQEIKNNNQVILAKTNRYNIAVTEVNNKYQSNRRCKKITQNKNTHKMEFVTYQELQTKTCPVEDNEYKYYKNKEIKEEDIEQLSILDYKELDIKTMMKKMYRYKENINKVCKKVYKQQTRFLPNKQGLKMMCVHKTDTVKYPTIRTCYEKRGSTGKDSECPLEYECKMDYGEGNAYVYEAPMCTDTNNNTTRYCYDNKRNPCGVGYTCKNQIKAVRKCTDITKNKRENGIVYIQTFETASKKMEDWNKFKTKNKETGEEEDNSLTDEGQESFSMFKDKTNKTAVLNEKRASEQLNKRKALESTGGTKQIVEGKIKYDKAMYEVKGTDTTIIDSRAQTKILKQESSTTELEKPGSKQRMFAGFGITDDMMGDFDMGLGDEVSTDDFTQQQRRTGDYNKETKKVRIDSGIAKEDIVKKKNQANALKDKTNAEVEDLLGNSQIKAISHSGDSPMGTYINEETKSGGELDGKSMTYKEQTTTIKNDTTFEVEALDEADFKSKSAKEIINAKKEGSNTGDSIIANTNSVEIEGEVIHEDDIDLNDFGNHQTETLRYNEIQGYDGLSETGKYDAIKDQKGNIQKEMDTQSGDVNFIEQDFGEATLDGENDIDVGTKALQDSLGTAMSLDEMIEIENNEDSGNPFN